MCFDPGAEPPPPPRSGLLGDSRRLELRTDDGNRLAATLATTSQPDAVGVVVLPDVRGLHPYYERLSEATADAGLHAIAVDLYGRTAGASHRDAGFEWQSHRAEATDAGVRADVRAAGVQLRAAGATRVLTWGFCFGGRASFMQASQPGIDGVIGFYGWPTRAEEDGSSPVDEARQGAVRVPVLAVYGGADEKITSDDRDAYEEALSRADVVHETVVYDGAPHSFFDRHAGEHADACADAWERVLAFAGRVGSGHG